MMPSSKIRKGAFDLINISIDSKAKGPVSSIIKRIIDIGRGYREAFLIKKIRTFLTSVKDLSDRERLRMMKSIDDNPNAFYERLWQIIDQNDSEYKTKIIARLTKAFARKQIPLEEFYILCKTVNDAHSADLKWVVKETRSKRRMRRTKPEILYGALVNQRLASVGITSSQHAYSVTETGKSLMEYGLGVTPVFSLAAPHKG